MRCSGSRIRGCATSCFHGSGARVRVVVAGREPPMLEWAIERGQLGGLEVLPLGPLDDESVREIVRSAGVEDGQIATAIMRVSPRPPARAAACPRSAPRPRSTSQSSTRCHVSSMRWPARSGRDSTLGRAEHSTQHRSRDVSRGEFSLPCSERMKPTPRSTCSVISHSSKPPPRGSLSTTQCTRRSSSGSVRSTPNASAAYRTAAWHHLQSESRAAGGRDLARSTADLLFLIDNPRVREAVFPTTSHLYSVERSRVDDRDDLRALWHRHDPASTAIALDAWLERAPDLVRTIRDRAGTVVGCSILADWRDMPHSLERDDPIMAAWAQHAAPQPASCGASAPLCTDAC